MQNTDNKKLNRWSPFIFKNESMAKNRVVVPPMASKTSDLEGFITRRTLSHYKNLAESGASIIMVEYTFVHKSGRSEINQLGLDTNAQIIRHKELVSIIKNSGALAGIQLVHCGGKSTTQLTNGSLLAPSAIPIPNKEVEFEIPKEINLDEIENYQNWYLESAMRAAESGYDIIELHSAHGYGLNQWLSPITNIRVDEYGGSLNNRSKMLLEIFQKIRKHLPNIVLGARIPGEDHFPGGLSKMDMIQIAQKLEDEGADFLDVSSGIGGWRRPNERKGEGYLLPDAANIQKNLSIPVFGVGGIESGAFIDSAIAQGKVSFTSVGRKILENPKEFYHQVLKL